MPFSVATLLQKTYRHKDHQIEVIATASLADSLERYVQSTFESVTSWETRE